MQQGRREALIAVIFLRLDEVDHLKVALVMEVDQVLTRRLSINHNACDSCLQVWLILNIFCL